MNKTPPALKDFFGIVLFVILVVVGATVINNYVFRSFNVEGPSMEKTLFTGDKLVVNKLPVTFSLLKGDAYQPKRGEVIVFRNPLFETAGREEYIVKRVIGLPGERVVVLKGNVKVYNKENPKGFDPDQLTVDSEGSPASGDADITVPVNQLFVMGDHRTGSFSFDSRNGLGTIPLKDVVGPVSLRIFPFQDFRIF